MSNSTNVSEVTVPAQRETWVAPRIIELDAGAAENGPSPVIDDDGINKS